MRSPKLFAFLLLIASLAYPFGALAAATAPAYHPARLFYYQNSPAAKADFFAHASSIDIFAPQTYALNSDGTLTGSLSQDLIDFATANQIKVMPLVTNDAFSSTSYQAILTNPAVEAIAVAALVTEAKNHNYYGWQIDFEQMNASYAAEFTDFIQYVAAVFHQNGLALSVAVIAKISDTPSDYPPQSWQNVVGVYDYASLASAADFLSIMSYDEPYNTGPAAPLPWIRQVLAYALAHAPSYKLSLGIPLYYWLRRDSDNKLVEIGGVKGWNAAFAKHYVTVHYSAHSQVPYLTWKSKGENYTLWYENARSIAAKLALVKADKLYGFSAWSLGLEIPNAWSAIPK